MLKYSSGSCYKPLSESFENAREKGPACVSESAQRAASSVLRIEKQFLSEPVEGERETNIAHVHGLAGLPVMPLNVLQLLNNSDGICTASS